MKILKTMLVILAAAGILLMSGCGASDHAIGDVVQTDKGEIRGFTVEEENGTQLHCYYGVPYAEAPVGQLRWRDAQEKTAWEGILDCNAPITEQNSNYQWGTNLLAYFLTLNESEDCLYLHVTTPAQKTDEDLPVIVWLHGGGMFGGSGSEEVYNLTNLPEAGCVLVAVTTRLGGFGMLTADALESEEGTSNAGNFMISDMLAALNWVQSNIEAFGGDPANVTIAGESGGACKVNALMACPQAEGLFCRAILQSGTAVPVSYEQAKESGNQLMEKLGVSTLEQAQAVPAEEVVAAYNELGLDSAMIVDGYYMPDDPVAAIEAGDYNSCDVLMGANDGELANLLPLNGGIPNYIRVLNRVAQDGNKAYAYLFDQIPATWRDLGFHSVHSLDLAYMFGTHDNSVRFYEGGPWEQQFMFWGLGESLDMADFISPQMDEADVELSDLMIRMWVNFVTSGDPSTENVAWEPYTPEDEDYMVLTNMNGAAPHMETGYSALEQEFRIP